MKKLLPIWWFLLAAPAWSAPTLVQHISGPGQEGHATTIKQYNLQLPNVVGAHNAVIVGISESGAAPATPSAVTDDKTNSYGAAQLTIAGANNKLFIYALCDITNGPRIIEVQYAASEAQPHRTVVVSEYYNVATSTCVDATKGNAPGTVSNTLDTGVFTTATSGDLIWSFGIVDDMGFAASRDTELEGWAQQGSYSALSNDVMQYATVNAFVASGTSPCSPTACNVSTYTNCTNPGCATEAWIVATIALKPATAGTAPTPGAIHVDRAYHTNVKVGWGSTTAIFGIPRGAANLIIGMGAGEPINGKWNSVSDGVNSWAPTPITFDNGGQVYSDLDYAVAPTSGDSAKATITYAGNITGGEPVMFLMVSNSSTTPFEQHITCNGNDTGGSFEVTVTCNNSITPGGTNQLLVGIGATNNNGEGETPVRAAAGQPFVLIVADSCSPIAGANCNTSPEIATSPIDENDLAAVGYLTNTNTITPAWIINNDTTPGTGQWTAIWALFEPSPPTAGGRLRTLLGVGR